MAFWDSWFGKKPAVPGRPGARPAGKGKPGAKANLKSTANLKLTAEKPAGPAARKGTRIDKRFRLIARMGQGSMSKVWRATDTEFGRDVVLKLLDKPKTDALKKRFVGLNRPDEGQVAMQLDHPNIVKTYEYGVSTKGEEYLVMEVVQGVGFNFMVETQAKELVGNEAHYLLQLAEAIKHLHEKGFIHRDICPRNAMVTTEGVMKLIDFGLAVPDTPEFRRPGNRTGTAAFMAPELIKRAPTDQRIDVFSFGVTMYQAYTGGHPWEDASAGMAQMLNHINSAARDPREFKPDMPDDLRTMLRKCIERDPRDRYQSMNQVLAALRALNPAAATPEASA